MTERTATYWAQLLNLQPHPEGGYYKETYRSEESLTADQLPDRFGGIRQVATAIYFLLVAEHFSAFHRIQSDELWHFHTGSPLRLYSLSPEGEMTEHLLGPDPEGGQHFQLVIPAGHWFAAEVVEPNGYTLVGCTVSPGFDFADFELADRTSLAHEFPAHAAIIQRLTRTNN